MGLVANRRNSINKIRLNYKNILTLQKKKAFRTISAKGLRKAKVQA